MRHIFRFISIWTMKHFFWTHLNLLSQFPSQWISNQMVEVLSIGLSFGRCPVKNIPTLWLEKLFGVIVVYTIKTPANQFCWTWEYSLATCYLLLLSAVTSLKTLVTWFHYSASTMFDRWCDMLQIMSYFSGFHTFLFLSFCHNLTLSSFFVKLCRCFLSKSNLASLLLSATCSYTLL